MVALGHAAPGRAGEAGGSSARGRSGPKHGIGWGALVGLLALVPPARAVVCPMPEPVLQAPQTEAAPEPALAASAGLASPIQVRWQVPGEAITVGRHFVMQVQLCPLDARLLRVDAVMPAHRHGMNYRPSLQALGQGEWQVDGLLLHMPGDWAWRFEVQAGQRRVTLRDAIHVP